MVEIAFGLMITVSSIPIQQFGTLNSESWSATNKWWRSKNEGKTMCRDAVSFLAIRVVKQKSVLGDSVGNYY